MACVKTKAMKDMIVIVMSICDVSGKGEPKSKVFNCYTKRLSIIHALIGSCKVLRTRRVFAAEFLYIAITTLYCNVLFHWSLGLFRGRDCELLIFVH